MIAELGIVQKIEANVERDIVLQTEDLVEGGTVP